MRSKGCAKQLAHPTDERSLRIVDEARHMARL